MLISQAHGSCQTNFFEESGKATLLRSLEEVTAEILQLEQETEGLLKRLVSFGN